MPGKKFTKKNNLSCPCKNKERETFKSENITLDLNRFDKNIESFFGESELIVSNKKYKLKKYRWLILICLLILLYFLINPFKSTSAPAPAPAPVLASAPASTPISVK